MDYRIEKNDGFKLLIKAKDFDNSIAGDGNNTEIPEFWDKSIKEGIMDLLNKHRTKEGVYGACGTMSEETNSFKYGIGAVVKDDFNDKDAPEGFTLWEMNYPTYAVFKCVGDTPECIGTTWGKIFKEFLPNTSYEMAEAADYEYYGDNLDEGVFCEIWIPVTKED